jgi:hypothetical protein
VGAFDQIGRFLDQVEHQIHKPSYSSHAMRLTMGAPAADVEDLRGGRQDAPLRP